MPSERGDAAIDLLQALEGTIKKVHTQSLDLSLNELLDMRKNDELDISPEYQRLFRWSEGTQSRFIESLLLEMPVPPIYVIEEETGRYSLIDGLQRISSYLHFRGELDAPHLDPPVRPGDFLTLTDCDIVEQLNGKRFEDLGTALQIRLKRAFVRVEVIRKSSDPRFKYYMFKRLNTGGVILSEQQIRNSTIRLLGAEFNDFIIALSQNDAFETCIANLTQERRLSQFDQELVLRFFALKNWRNAFRHDVGDFLTEYMEQVTEARLPFDYKQEKAIFEKTFGVLKEALGELAFSLPNKTRDKLTRGFSVYHFEAITIGIQAQLDSFDPSNATQMRMLGEKLQVIKCDPAFVDITQGGGKNSPGPLRQRILFVEERVREPS